VYSQGIFSSKKRGTKSAQKDDAKAYQNKKVVANQASFKSRNRWKQEAKSLKSQECIEKSIKSSEKRLLLRRELLLVGSVLLSVRV
jgi:hypothetical protein